MYSNGYPLGGTCPGPLTMATISLGIKHRWKAGLRVALGHVLVELPYIATLLSFLKKHGPLLKVSWAMSWLSAVQEPCCSSPSAQLENRLGVLMRKVP
ncbi:MAG: hypothetical protein QXP89_03095 [Desulfurococcaceae archaeon]